MKKLSHLILPVLVAIGINICAAEEQTSRVERTKRWIKEKATQAKQYMPEDKTVAKGIQYGTMATGMVAGYIAGTIATKKLALWLQHVPVVVKVAGASEKKVQAAELTAIYGTHVAGAVAAGAVSGLASRLGLEGAILYLSKRRNVSRDIAYASLIADVSLDDEIKQLFQAAQDGNSEFLKGFFTAYYEKLFGDNWYQIVTSPKLDLPLVEVFKISQKRAKTASLPYVAALMYWNKKMKTAGVFTKLKATRKLLRELFDNGAQ